MFAKLSPGIQKIGLILLGIGLLGAGILLYLVNPSEVTLYPCGVRATTGLYCPGCGLTRATHALLTGQWVAALMYNPLVFLVIPLIIYAYAALVGRVFFKKDLMWRKEPYWLGIGLAIFFVLFMVARNIPTWGLYPPS